MNKLFQVILTVAGSFMVGLPTIFAVSLIGDLASSMYDQDKTIYWPVAVIVGYIAVYTWQWFGINYEEVKVKPKPRKWYNLFVTEENEK